MPLAAAVPPFPGRDPEAVQLASLVSWLASPAPVDNPARCPHVN